MRTVPAFYTDRIIIVRIKTQVKIKDSMDNQFGEQPPYSGEISFAINRKPVSLQSNSRTKLAFKEHIKEIVNNPGYLLSGDIKIIIKWNISEEERYETSMAADVDNIIKPLQDSLAGPNGIFVDDTQVQSVECSWRDCFQHCHEFLDITITYSNDEYLTKNGLVFIEFENKICLPTWKNMGIQSQRIQIEAYERMINTRNELRNQGLSYHDSRSVMPIQRVFHKNRIKDFEIQQLELFKQTLSIS